MSSILRAIPVHGNYEKGYRATIKRSPKEPDFENFQENVIPEQATEWVRKHERKYRRDLTLLVSEVRRISFEDFKSNLKNAIKSTLSQLGASDNEEAMSLIDRSVVLVENKKSNQWVAELAKRHFKFKADRYYRLGIKGARRFVEHIRNHADSDEKQYFEDKNLILFDDGSYSGKQITDHVVALLKLKSDKELKFQKICVIIPYMTTRAERKLGDLVEKEHTSDVVISAAERIPTVAESLPEDSASRLSELWWSKENPDQRGHSRGVVWFDHKVPNDQSFVGAVKKGNVVNSQEVCKEKFQLIPPKQEPYKR